MRGRISLGRGVVVVVGTALQYFMLVHCIFGSVLLLYLVVTVAP